MTLLPLPPPSLMPLLLLLQLLLPLVLLRFTTAGDVAAPMAR